MLIPGISNTLEEILNGNDEYGSLSLLPDCWRWQCQERVPLPCFRRARYCGRLCERQLLVDYIAERLGINLFSPRSVD